MDSWVKYGGRNLPLVRKGVGRNFCTLGGVWSFSVLRILGEIILLALAAWFRVFLEAVWVYLPCKSELNTSKTGLIRGNFPQVCVPVFVLYHYDHIVLLPPYLVYLDEYRNILRQVNFFSMLRESNSIMQSWYNIIIISTSISSGNDVSITWLCDCWKC